MRNNKNREKKMNNEIPSELTKFVKPVANKAVSKPISSTSALANSDFISNYDSAQDCLNNMGHAKVNLDKKAMSNRVISSLGVLKKDAQYVQSHVEFCDNLVQKGYSLEDAVLGTDIIFKHLQNKSTYTP
jgi:hypothetical protein